MGQQVLGVAIGLGVELLDDRRQPLARYLHIVDQVDFPPCDLDEPDGGCVIDTQIPCRPDLLRWLPRDIANPLVRIDQAELFSVERALDSGVEGALKLLVILVGSHDSACVTQFGLRQELGIGSFEHERFPPFSALGVLEQPVELVPAFGRAYEDCPAATVSQRRPDNLDPRSRVHVPELIEDDPVEIDPAQSVVIVSSEQLYAGGVGQVSPEFRLVDCRARYLERVVLDVIPTRLLGLSQERGNVGVTRPWLVAPERSVHRIGNGAHGLATPPVNDSDPETRFRFVEGLLPGPRSIAKVNCRHEAPR